MSNYKNQAIDLLLNMSSDDMEKACIELVKHNPAAFVKACGGRLETSDKKLAKQVIEIGKQHAYPTGDPNKVAMIKHVRSVKKISLKEAKEWVERHCY